jgi:hypothetical protein
MLRRIVKWILILTALMGLLMIQAWPAIIRIGMDASLRRHATAVRNAAIPIEDKERLLDLIKSIEDRLHQEEIILFEWARHDQAINEIKQGGIVGDEVRLIEREFRRAKSVFKEPQP